MNAWRVAAWAIALGCAGVGAARAQTAGANGCVLDRCEDRDGPAPRGGSVTRDPASPGPVFRRSPTSQAGNFDFYVLALSWSSGFCEAGGAEKARDQCAAGANLGFVVHGLWPQFEHGFPSDCDPGARPVTRTALETTVGLYPSEGLARYEWRKHGTCTGKPPVAYFNDVRVARDKVQIPSEFLRLRNEEKVDPGTLARTFLAANAGLRPNMIAIDCQRGILQEVRICLSKDLRDFHACPEVARATCRSSEIAVPAPR